MYITTFVGVFGASVGSMTSLSTAWLAQRSQLREVRRNAAKQVREELFRDFISEASRLYGDALSHEKDDVSSLVALYALVGRIRLVASSEVIAAAEKAMDTIIEAYLAPNRSLRELRDFARAGRVDFLQEFAAASRAELVEVLAGRPLTHHKPTVPPAGHHSGRTASQDGAPLLYGEEEFAAIRRLSERQK